MKDLIEKILHDHGVKLYVSGFATGDLPVSTNIEVKSGRYLVQVGDDESEVALFISNCLNDDGEWEHIKKVSTCAITNEETLCRLVSIRIGSLYYPSENKCLFNNADKRVSVFGSTGTIVGSVGSQLDVSLWKYKIKFDNGDVGMAFNWQVRDS